MQNKLESLRDRINEETVCDSLNIGGYHTTKNETRIHNLEQIAKKNKYKFMKEGLTLVKPELAEEWVKFVNENSKNDYFAIVIEAIVSIMNKMNSGISFTVAQKQTCFNELELSGFQESVVVCAVSRFYNNAVEATNNLVEPFVVTYSKK